MNVVVIEGNGQRSVRFVYTAIGKQRELFERFGQQGGCRGGHGRGVSSKLSIIRYGSSNGLADYKQEFNTGIHGPNSLWHLETKVVLLSNEKQILSMNRQLLCKTSLIILFLGVVFMIKIDNNSAFRPVGPSSVECSPILCAHAENKLLY